MSGASDDDLLDQWAFLDRMTQRQAAQLRSGVQDEEDEGVVAAPPAPPAGDLEPLRARIAELERAAAALNDRLTRQAAELDEAGRRRGVETAEHETRLAGLREELNRASTRTAELERQRDALQRERDALAAQLAQAGSRVNELMTELASARAAAEAAAHRRWWRR